MTRELFVYSGRNRPDLTPAYRLFEQVTDTQVTVVKLDHQAVVPRLVAEDGARGADVLVTNSQLQSEQLRQAGLLEPYAAPVARDYEPWLRAPDFSWLSFPARPR